MPLDLDPARWSELSPWLDQALDLPTEEERDAWLRGLPAEARPLHDTLARLLHDYARAQTADFLAVPARPERLLAAASVEGYADVGRVVGPYRLMRELGRGGMGSVWLAERVDGVLKRPVALKLPHPGLASGGFAERLARERDILASLDHPNIARLYDAGISDDGQPFIALEYIEGRTLLEDCDAVGRGIRARLELFLQVLDAVQYAHLHLVLHRDLKPSNVLVDAQARARLLDFGVAKLMVDGQGEATALTLDAGRALTPDFAAPEQIFGQPLSTASDVYSLGVLLYQLLTGRRPYRLAGSSLVALEQALFDVDVPRPSAAVTKDRLAAERRGATPAQLARQLRGDLDTIVLKAMKSKPEDRYETVAALRGDIQRFLDGRPVQALPDSRWYVLRKFVARNRIAVAGAATAIVAVTAAAVGFAVETRVALRERDYARSLADRSDATARFLNDLLIEAGQSKGPVSIGDLLERSEKLVSDGYRDNPDHRAAVLDQLAMYHLTVGNFPKAATLMARARDAAAGSSDPALVDQLRCNQAITLANQGQADAGIKQLDALLGHEFPDPRVRVVCTLYRSFIAHNTNDLAGSLRYAELARAALPSGRDALPELEAHVLGTLAAAYQDNARNREADRMFAAAMQKYVELGRERGHVALTVRNNWAALRGDAGEPKAQLAMLDEIIDITRHEDPNAEVPLYLLVNRAHTLRAVGRYDDAVHAYEDALAVARKQGNLGFQGSSLLGLAGVARDRGDLAGAERLIDEAQTLVGDRMPAGSAVMGRLRAERAFLALALNRPADAARTFDAAVAGPAPLAAQVIALVGRAESALQANRLQAAHDDAARALDLAQSLQAGNAWSSRTGGAWLELGRVRLAQGDHDGGVRALQTAIEHLSNTVDPSHTQLLAARTELQRATGS